jgi:NAD(P)-dependent dehydrogenase (short-subunit alcohol dehydrogenase family)
MGRATAKKFASNGYDVIVTGRRLEALRETAEFAPDRITWFKGDVTQDEDRAGMLAAAIDRTGRLDVLVNNAAYQKSALFVDFTRGDIDLHILTNLTAPLLLIQAALPFLARTRGNVVNVTSAATLHYGQPPAQVTPYAAAKAGLNQLTRQLAGEVGKDGIRINAVSPGFTDTEMAAKAMEIPAAVDWMIRETALRRVGRSDDIADVIFFLASDQARWITGEIIQAAGGMYLK